MSRLVENEMGELHLLKFGESYLCYVGGGVLVSFVSLHLRRAHGGTARATTLGDMGNTRCRPPQRARGRADARSGRALHIFTLYALAPPMHKCHHKPLIHLLTHSLAHSFAHQRIHSLTHSVIHSLAPSLMFVSLLHALHYIPLFHTTLHD